MRSRDVIALVLWLVPLAARAAPFAELGAGATVSNERTVDVSPTPLAAVGDRGVAQTALLSFAFTPARVGDTSGVGTVFRPEESPIRDPSLLRIRVLANLEGRHRLAERRSLTLRGGIGVDIRRSSWVSATSMERSRSENGFAFELAVTHWFERGSAAYGIALAGTMVKYDQPPFGGTDEPGITTMDLALSFVARLSAR